MGLMTSLGVAIRMTSSFIERDGVNFLGLTVAYNFPHTYMQNFSAHLVVLGHLKNVRLSVRVEKVHNF